MIWCFDPPPNVSTPTPSLTSALKRPSSTAYGMVASALGRRAQWSKGLHLIQEMRGAMVRFSAKNPLWSWRRKRLISSTFCPKWQDTCMFLGMFWCPIWSSWRLLTIQRPGCSAGRRVGVRSNFWKHGENYISDFGSICRWKKCKLFFEWSKTFPQANTYSEKTIKNNSNYIHRNRHTMFFWTHHRNEFHRVSELMRETPTWKANKSAGSGRRSRRAKRAVEDLQRGAERLWGSTTLAGVEGRSVGHGFPWVLGFLKN